MCEELSGGCDLIVRIDVLDVPASVDAPGSLSKLIDECDVGAGSGLMAE